MHDVSVCACVVVHVKYMAHVELDAAYCCARLLCH